MAAKAKPQVVQPTCVVAIDFGTAATGYCIAQIPSIGSPISSARVFPFKPGDRGAAATEKNLTSVLLTQKSLAIVAFGREARRRFYEMDPDEQKDFMYLEQFKMAMAPSRRGKVPLSQRKVHALGADVAVPLSTATAKCLEAVRLEALDRLLNLGVAPDSIAWCLTVPAIWDDEAKHFMREAAEQAGIPTDKLSLCLEPEGAVIAAMSEATPEIQRKLAVGSGVMILDCGGGTVDITVSNVVGTEPYALSEILPASGDAWGGTLVDAEYRKFANTLLCPPEAAPAPAPAPVPAPSAPAADTEASSSGSAEDVTAASASDVTLVDPPTKPLATEPTSSTSAAPAPAQQPLAQIQRADPAALASMMDAWENAKVGWDPEDPGRAIVKVGGLAGVCEAIGGPEAMQARVAAFNTANGFTGPEAVVYKPRAFALWLPPKLVQSFFDRCVANISAHVLDLFAEAEDMGHPIHFVFLVGGFAESVYLQRSIRAALKLDPSSPPLAELIVPHKPVQSVNRGSALWALYPKLITARVSKYTYAVDLAEIYDPAVHDPLPSRAYLQDGTGGRYTRHVLVPLVQKGDEVPTDAFVEREVNPLLDTQTTVNFDIYRLNCRLPPIETRLRRAFVWEADLPEPSQEALRLIKDPASLTKTFGKIGEGLNKLARGAAGRKRRNKLRAAGQVEGQADSSPSVVDVLPEYLPMVREKDLLATIGVNIPKLGSSSGSKGKSARLAMLSLYFGRTEITATATAVSTGEKREVTMHFQS